MPERKLGWIPEYRPAHPDYEGGADVNGDALRTAMEVLAVLLLAAGLGLVVAAMVGGLLGTGLGLAATGACVLAAAEVSRMVHRPSAESEARS